MVEVYLGLGSNVGDRSGFLKTAVDRINEIDGARVMSLSSIYRTEPVGPISQNKYFNAVVRLEVALKPQELLTQLLKIEKACGRIRNERWGPRTLDIDILLFGDLEVRDDNLSIPHPLMLERAFVLAPLVEVCPNLIIGDRSARERLEQLEDEGVERLIAFDRSETVGIIGASSKPDRYSNRAQRMLMDYGHSVVPVSHRDESIMEVDCVRSICDHSGEVDSLTLYLAPERQTQIIGELVASRPKRVIFNPGTESEESRRQFEDAGIATEYACTLVLLQTNQFS